MADSEKVLEQIDLPNDVEIIGIVVNEKGAERAIATQAFQLWVSLAQSPRPFCAKTRIRQLDECYKVLESIKRKADNAGLSTVAYISMALETRMAIRGMRRTFARRSINLSISIYNPFRLLTPSAWRVLI
jgi:hypothetical protein